jgi:chromosome segregation ATPase
MKQMQQKMEELQAKLNEMIDRNKDLDTQLQQQHNNMNKIMIMMDKQQQLSESLQTQQKDTNDKFSQILTYLNKLTQSNPSTHGPILLDTSDIHVHKKSKQATPAPLNIAIPMHTTQLLQS